MATRKPASKTPAVKTPVKAAAPAPAKKAPVKAPVKPAPAKKAVAAPKAVAVAKKAVAAKPGKVKPKLVRDSFTMPKAEYVAIDVLKQRAAKLARPVKKSELLRAGVKLLNALDDKALLAAVNAVPTIKTGRPGKG
ncbi:MAG: hypothetical protein ACKOF9_16325 [Burkholderiales bacterium]